MILEENAAAWRQGDLLIGLLETLALTRNICQLGALIAVDWTNQQVSRDLGTNVGVRQVNIGGVGRLVASAMLVVEDGSYLQCRRLQGWGSG